MNQYYGNAASAESFRAHADRGWGKVQKLRKENKQLRSLLARAIERGGCGSSMWMEDAIAALKAMDDA